jgi:hypothetical protein
LFIKCTNIRNIIGEYKISKQSISPETVKVTGGEQQLKNIAYLKATFILMSGCTCITRVILFSRLMCATSGLI